MIKNLLLFLFLTFPILINASEPTTLDNEVAQEFEQLDEIENYLKSHEVTLKELKLNNPNLTENINLESQNAFTDDKYDSTLGIPPFLWGCVFGIIGILLVFILTDKDKSVTKKAAMGCLVTYGTIAAVYLVLIIVGLTSSAAFY